MPGRLKPAQARVIWMVVGALFALMIGLRHEVGGDWFNYLRLFQRTSELDLDAVISGGDPGYYGVSWVVARAGGSVHYVNLVCAVILMTGITVFCRAQPNPWLALLTAVPFLMIVVGMGYTRQAAALGFALLALAALASGKIRTFILWVALAAIFHKSAVLLAPIAGLAASRNRLTTIAIATAGSFVLYYLLLADETEKLWRNYVEAELLAKGALIRVWMNVVPASILILLRARLVPDVQERKLWLWMAVLALICLPFVGKASSAVDRVALYILPIQLFVFSRIPRLASTAFVRTGLVLGVIGYYAAVQFVWLNYGVHARFWLPYQFMPLW